MTIPLIDLKTQYQALKPQIQARIDAVLEHGQYIMGPEVKELEDKLAAFTGAKHCITCASGSEALLMSLMALGIGPGDEIVTTPFTFVATAEVIVLLGAKPVFVDVEPDTCNINADLIEAAITPRTKAIMPVSLYGQTADMDAINDIASSILEVNETMRDLANIGEEQGKEQRRRAAARIGGEELLRRRGAAARSVGGGEERRR